MPHVVLRLPADVTEIGRRFQPHAVAIDATEFALSMPISPWATAGY